MMEYSQMNCVVDFKQRKLYIGIYSERIVWWNLKKNRIGLFKVIVIEKFEDKVYFFVSLFVYKSPHFFSFHSILIFIFFNIHLIIVSG